MNPWVRDALELAVVVAFGGLVVRAIRMARRGDVTPPRCPDCGHAISRAYPRCPHCGADVEHA